MDRKIKKMLKLAKRTRGNAYAPYSKFKVGACILTKKGSFYVGANAENSAYPEGTCAETNAIGAMVSAGEREIEKVVLIGPDYKIITPCGGCRQRLAEFADKDIEIYLFNDAGDLQKTTVGELLPGGFSLNEK
ncbi:MAG: cytidine deaminase [Alphaproteobacteria bacterium]|jgi:cytidine deaminase|nr:cytidine deaminase [Alphaproteobacteria bacterium]MCV6599002.1 cytidine deaminase [Alphaproteobacteria bacterium]